MHHIAILRKAKIKKGDNLLKDILTGRKSIESRWHINKVAPWNKVHKGDTIYFKEASRPVAAKATVSKTIQYENLDPETIDEIITTYGEMIAPHTSTTEWKIWAKHQQRKKYCILVFLENVERLKPFEIDKTGYGISSAWLVTENINKLIKPT